MKKKYLFLCIAIMLFVLVLGIAFVIYLINGSKVSLYPLRENFYYCQALEEDDYAAGVNVFLYSKKQIDPEEFSDISFPDAKDQEYIVSEVSVLEHQGSYLYTCNMKILMKETLDIEVKTVNLKIRGREYSYDIGVHRIRIFPKEEFELLNVMMGPIGYRTYKAITGLTNKYTIYFSNQSAENLTIDKISILNGLLIDKVVIDDTVMEDEYTIASGEDFTMVIELVLPKDHIFYTVTPSIRYKIGEVTYEQYMPAAYLGHYALEDAMETFVSQKEGI